MRINQVETIILSEILRRNGHSVVEKSLDEIRVEERCYTGVGVFSEFESHSTLFVGGEDRTCGIPCTVLVNSTILTGHVYYVKDGYIETIESYTYHNKSNVRPDWPTAIETAEVVGH